MEINILLLFFILTSVVGFIGVGVLSRKIFYYKNKNEDLSNKIAKVTKEKKASEIRVGYIIEQVAPLLDKWEGDPVNFKFLGKPIDGIQFNDDEIIFIEIKSGRSGLSKNQREIKEKVENGKVKFKTFRVNENGIGYK